MFCLQAQKKRRAEIQYNILDVLTGSQLLCDCLLILLILCGAEGNPEFIL